jgi:ABC-type Na+ transport system ATPase subunit NatA
MPFRMRRRYRARGASGNLSRRANVGGLEPLLRARDLRIDVDGIAVVDGATFATNGRRVALLGAPRELFLATVGWLPVLRGELAIEGLTASDAARDARVAGAPLDPRLPPSWLVAEYVTWSARLAGVPAFEARKSAEAAIARLELGALAKTRLGTLVPPARRATVIAAAIATYADVVALEDPLAGLLDEHATALGGVLGKALEGRAALIFAPRIASSIASTMDEGIVFGHACTVEAQGAPNDLDRDATRWSLRLTSHTDAVAARLVALGAVVEARAGALVVDAGPLTTRAIVAACDAEDAGIVELLPAPSALT